MYRSDGIQHSANRWPAEVDKEGIEIGSNLFGCLALPTINYVFIYDIINMSCTKYTFAISISVSIKLL